MDTFGDMQMLKHNKKRNVGLLNEFFAQYMANAAVDFRFDDYAKADALWKKHFKEGTELAKELQMFEAVANANLKDRTVAHKMLEQVKRHVKTQNQEKLDREKTTLIHEIRSEIADDNFFDRQIEDYKTNATIQLVLNHWRNGDEESVNKFSTLSHLEEKVVDHMVSGKAKLPPFDNKLLETSKEDIDKLVIHVFREKVEQKYDETLNEDQKEIIGLYTFANKSEESRQALERKLKSIKEGVLNKISGELSGADNKTPSESLLEVKKCLNEENYNIQNPDEETITFYLSVCSLKHELESE